MSADSPGRLEQYLKQTVAAILKIIKDIPDLLKEFKGAVIVIIVWLIVAQLAGYSVTSTIISIIKLVLYPLYLLLFNTEFSDMNIPEIFILMMPLVLLTFTGFLIIIATED